MNISRGYNSIGKITTTLLLAVVFGLSLLWVSNIVNAGASFNNNPQDLATVRVSNFTANPNSTTNWTSSVSANPGDTVSVAIYYHNTSGETAVNTRVSISMPSSAGTTITVGGGVSADNASGASGSATIILPSSQTLTYIPGSASWYPDQSVTASPFPYDPNGDSVVTSSVNIGDIAPDGAQPFAHQGSVVARFLVSNNYVTPPVAPSPSADIKANGSDGPVTLTQGQDLDLSWTSLNTVTCALSAPAVQFNSNVATSGSTVISSTNSFYPTTSPVTYTILCNSAQNATATDLVIVNPPQVLPPTPQVPAAPVITVSTDAQCGGNIDVSWNAVSSATSYKIFRNATQVGTTTNTTFTDTGLTTSFPFSYTVIASNSTGDSASSNSATALSSASCGGGGGIPNPTVDITANGSQGPVVLLSGQSFTLNWISTNTTSCHLSIQGGQDLGGVPVNGSAGPINSQNPFYPAQNTSNVFVIVCAGSNGQNATDTVTVTNPPAVIIPPQSPISPTLTATTGSCGGNVDLSWNAVSGANYYKVFRNNVFIASTTTTSFVDNGQAVSTAFSYNVKATNAAGDSSASNTANAVSSAQCSGGGTPTPTVTLTSNPPTISLGATSTLSWMSTNTTGCSASWTNSTSTSGSEDVSPATTTTYSMLCAGQNSNASATTTVTVNPVVVINIPSVILSANPSTISSGSSSTLSWISADVDTCSAPWTNATSTSDSESVNPTSTTSYTVSCTGQFGSASSTATVTVTTGGGGGGTPTPTVTLTSNPPTISLGATSTLSWMSTNTTGCSASWTNSTSTSGSEDVSPATTTNYSIACSGSFGSGSATTTVTVTNGGIGGGPQCVAPTIDSALAETGVIGNPFTYTLDATSTATSSISYTIATSSLPAGLTLSGNTISGTPTTQQTATIVVTATNGCGTDTENLVITIAPVSPGSGGSFPGGGGGNGIYLGNGGQPEVLGASTGAPCDYLKDYLHIGWSNDPFEVTKLQIFLKDVEGFKDITINGVFDQTTFNDVSAFQKQYSGDILIPWGYSPSQSTGFVYILTKKKVNEIVCNEAFPVNPQQQQEINNFRAFMQSLNSRGISINGTQGQNSTTNGVSQSPQGQNNSVLSQNGINFSQGTVNTSDQNSVGMISATSTERLTLGQSRALHMRSVAAAILAGPNGLVESINTIIGFIAILLALYLITNALINVQNQNEDSGLSKEVLRVKKFLYFILGIVLVIFLSFVLKLYTIILPLLILVIILSTSLLWFTIREKDVETVSIPLPPASSTPVSTPSTVENTTEAK